MTEDELREEIESCAEYCRTDGMFVEINYGLPYVAVYLGKNKYGEDVEFFFQGEEADDLIMEAEQIDYVSPGDYILWSAQGW